MASNINPNNIDTTYPIAGQDNDSQGFRDNFTNIKTNFQYAETEIDDLQAKVLLKSALTGTTLDNDLAGALLVGAKIQDFSATRVALGTITNGSTATINYAAGHYHTLSTDVGGSQAITLAFSNFPTSGNSGWVTVRITVTTAGDTVTLPSAVGTSASAKSVSGVQGISSNVITFAEAGTYEFVFHTDDGGSTVYLSELTRPRNRWTNPLFLTGGEDLAASGAASLTKTTSYFTTATAETATLAAGTDGQVKVLAMYGDGGDMVITVTNAGWKSSGTGTITFSEIGQTVTLMYINSKWFCVGQGAGAANGLAQFG